MKAVGNGGGNRQEEGWAQRKGRGAMRMSLLGGLVGYERIFSIISIASRTPESTFEISTISRIWSIRYFSSPPEPDDYVTSSASVPSNRPSERQQSGMTKICNRIKVGCGFF
jgi:hypothetical protein